MRTRPQAQGLFPIAVMLLLVGLTFWLQQAVMTKESRSDTLLRHDPDFIVDNFTVRRFSPAGDLQHTLVASRMVHYPDDDTSVASEPRVTFLKGPRPTRLTAKQALIAADAREVELIGSVRGVREATASDPEIVFTSDRLTIFPDDELARTATAVTVTQGASVIRGVGLEADNKTQTYQLDSQVSATIEKKNPRR